MRQLLTQAMLGLIKLGYPAWQENPKENPKEHPKEHPIM
jgi:hypothetical protein